MEIADVVSKRSNCMSRQVAAVIVKENQILATGYNGTPKGVTNCCDGGCPRCNNITESGEHLEECLCCHAEENSICQAAKFGLPINESAMYCTLMPCLHCSKLIINSGIKKLIYRDVYNEKHQAISSNLLRDGCVEIIRIVNEDNHDIS